MAEAPALDDATGSQATERGALASGQPLRLDLWRVSWERLAFCLPVLITGLIYALYTQHAWEDFFITFRHSRNLVEGHGLVFQPGEYIHGFTSPINVLLPALFYWLTGATSYLPALWLFRIASLLFLSAGLWVLYPALQQRQLPRFGILLAGVMLAFESKTIVYATNGQEAGFMVGFLAMGLAAVLLGLRTQWLLAGIAWGGLMWSRPDGFIFVAALGLTGLFFAERDQRAAVFQACIKASAVCTIIYLPWFAWAWWYYGSPVPHTVMAKSNYAAAPDLAYVLKFYPGTVFAAAAMAFEPINAQCGGWPRAAMLLAPLLGAFCVVATFVKGVGQAVRMIALISLMVLVYLALLRFKQTIFAWYLPPAASLGVLILALGPMVLAQRAPQQWRWVGKAASCGACLFMAYLFAVQTQHFHEQQRIVETDHRREIGLWLGEHVGDDERIMLECLGYIGYFSNKRMLDYPGLASPEMVHVIEREGLEGTPMVQLIPYLNPEWLVLRKLEAQQAMALGNIEGDYDIIKHFDANPQVEQADCYGKGCLGYDAEFFVFRRKDLAGR